MTTKQKRIVSSLQASIAACGVADAVSLSRDLNGMFDDPALVGMEAAIGVLKMAADEGIPPLLKGLAGRADIDLELDALAIALATKRHLAPPGATYAVRTWAAAIGVLPSPTPAGKPAPGGAWAILRRIPWYVYVVAAITLIGLGVYYRREIELCLVAAMFAGGVGAIGYFVLGVIGDVIGWIFRKLHEGLKQIKYALDHTPGIVFLAALVAFGVSDWFGVLPFGMRQIAEFMRDVDRRSNMRPAAEGNKEDKKTLPISIGKIARQAPGPAAIEAAEPPPKKTVHVPATATDARSKRAIVQQRPADSTHQQQKEQRAIEIKRRPTPAASTPGKANKDGTIPLPDSAIRRQTLRASELNREVQRTHVIEYHLAEHRNDALHLTVHENVDVGSIVAATVRGQRMTLQVMRPIGFPNGRRDAPRWLAAPMAEDGTMLAGTAW